MGKEGQGFQRDWEDKKDNQEEENEAFWKREGLETNPEESKTPENNQ